MEPTRRTTVFNKLPSWIRYGFIGIFGFCAISWQLRYMYEYSQVLESAPDPAEIPRPLRLGNYEGPNMKPKPRKDIEDKS